MWKRGSHKAQSYGRTNTLYSNLRIYFLRVIETKYGVTVSPEKLYYEYKQSISLCSPAHTLCKVYD